MKSGKTIARILTFLLKNLEVKATITLLAKEVGLSREGVWKILKKLQSEKLVLLSQIGTGKTNTYLVKLDWENPLLEKTLALRLAEEAFKNQRWLINFKELEDKLNFLIIYGSILNTPKEANDIDLIGAANKTNFSKIDNIINKIQKTQIKKIHALNFTEEELRKELEKPNKAFIRAVKEGVVLFGQERFIKFVRGLKSI